MVKAIQCSLWFVLFYSVLSSATRKSTLLSRLEFLENVVMDLKNAVNSLEKENAKLKEDKSLKVTTGFVKREDRVNHPQPRLLLESSTASQYAFYAYLSHDEPDPGAHHLLIYDVMQTNAGNAYNKFTGIFTIPMDGIYSFTWSTRVACHKSHTTELVVDTKVLGSTYVYCNYNTVTGHVITTALKGQAVYIRTHETAGGQGAIKSDQYGRSAFSGFLIH